MRIASVLSRVFAAGSRRRPLPRARRAASGWETIGRSAEGRPIRALRVGSRARAVKLMVVGTIHGNEPAGRAVIARLRGARPPRGTALWLVDDANPDGAAAGSGSNANGVDLNRNFPYRWRPQDGVYESGRAPRRSPRRRSCSASSSASARA